MFHWFIDHTIARRILPTPKASVMSCESKWESTQAVTNFTVIADSVRQGDLVIEVMNDLAIHATSNMDVSLMRTSALSVAILAAATVTANLSRR